MSIEDADGEDAIQDAIDNIDTDDQDDADDSADDADADDADDSADDAGADDDADAAGSSTTGDKSAKRRETRVQKLANELREERDRRVAAEARAEERERTKTTQTQDPSEAARVRQEKLDLMDPAEKRAFFLEEQVAGMRREQMVAQIRTADDLDKRDYLGKADRNPVYARHQTKVEQVLAEMRRNGSNAPRETVLRYVIGDEAMKAKPSKTKTKEKEAAAERVKTSKAAPTSARNDGGTKKSGGEETAEQLKAKILAREASGAM